MSGSRASKGGRAVLLLLTLGLVAGSVCWLLPATQERPIEEAGESTLGPVADQPAQAKPPELIGVDDQPSAPAEAAETTTAGVPPEQAKSPDTWQIDFTVEGAPRWQRAIFVPTEPSGDIVRVSNSGKGPAHGSIDAKGSGRLVLNAEQRKPWISEVLEAPKSGVLVLTASVDLGLSVSGTVMAGDGLTPLSEGIVRVKQDAGIDDIPGTAPIAGWAVVGANGRFHVTGLNPGAVRVQARSKADKDGARVELEAQAGDANIHIQLKPMGVVILSIFDVATKRAPQTPRVEVEYPHDSGRMAMGILSSPALQFPKSPATFRLTNIQVGKPDFLLVRAKGYAPYELELDLPPGGAVQSHDIPMEQAENAEATLHLTLRFEGDAPETIMITRQMRHVWMSNEEKIENGTVTVPLSRNTRAVLIGSVLRLGPQAWALVKVPLDDHMTRPGTRIDRDITMVRGGVLRFREPPPNGTGVTFTRGDERVELHVRNSVVSAIPPGAWHYRLQVSTSEIWTGDVAIRSGETTATEPTRTPVPAK